MTDFARQYMLSSADDVSEITSSVASKIESKTLKFADFIASVQEYAVHDDLTIQAKSIGYISKVLAFFKPDTLSRVEISVLVTFFCTRIEDNAGVREASQGLRTLLEMTRFMKDDVVAILEAIFKNTAELQRHLAPTRFAVYCLVEKSLERYREVLEGMGERFIDGILALVEFEKEPRNLMIVFSILRVVMAEFVASERQTEALWDAVFRYYPITFTPKPGYNIQITKQDLQHRLHSCLISNSRFAPYAFPSLLSKLDQELSPAIQIETLKIMASSIEGYSSAVTASFADYLFTRLKLELHSDAEQAEISAKIMRLLYMKVFSDSNEFAVQRILISLARNEIISFLYETTPEQSRKTRVIIEAVGSGTPGAFCRLLQSIMPAVVTAWQSVGGDIGKIGSMLNVFNGIVDEANYCYDLPVDHPHTANKPLPGRQTRETHPGYLMILREFKPDLLRIYDEALSNQKSSIQIMAVKGQLKMASIQNFLSYEELTHIVYGFGSILMSEDSINSDVRDEAIEALLRLSAFSDEDFTNFSPQASARTMDAGALFVRSLVYPKIRAAITTIARLGDGYERCIDLLKCWAAISLDVKLFEHFLTDMRLLLMTALNAADATLFRLIMASMKSALEAHILRVRNSSGSLRFALNNSPVDYFGFAKQLCQGLVEYVEETQTLTLREWPLDMEDSDLIAIGSILLLVFRSVEACQKDVAAEVFTLFGLTKEDDATNQVRALFRRGSNLVHSSNQVRRTAILSKFLLESLRPTAEIANMYDFKQILSNILGAGKVFAENSDSHRVKSAYAQMFAIVTNKFHVETMITAPGFEEPVDEVLRMYFGNSFDPPEWMSAIEASFYADLAIKYAAAMVKKGNKELYLGKIDTPNPVPLPFLQHLITFLAIRGPTPAHMSGQKLAIAFGEIVHASAYLHKQNHAVVSRTYEKDFYTDFSRHVITLCNAHQSSDWTREYTKNNCLDALTTVMKEVKAQDFIFARSPIKLMIRVIDELVSRAAIRVALDVLAIAVRSHMDLVAPLYDEVMLRFTRCLVNLLSTISKLKALRGLVYLAQNSTAAQKRAHKTKVLRTLTYVMGSCAPEVRSEAVDCERLWNVSDDSSEE